MLKAYSMETALTVSMTTLSAVISVMRAGSPSSEKLSKTTPLTGWSCSLAVACARLNIVSRTATIMFFEGRITLFYLKIASKL